MVWDLQGALLKKQEIETARLLDFEFRQRARAMKLLADALGVDVEELVRSIVLTDDETILRRLANQTGLDEADIERRFQESRHQARLQLIAQLGDPRPYPLA
jgi:hypothetical protein